MIFFVFLKQRGSLSETHHLCVAGVEGLLVQGELLRAEGVVEFDHVGKLRERERERESESEIEEGERESGGSGGRVRERAVEVFLF